MKRNILLLVLSSCAALSLTNCNNKPTETPSDSISESIPTETPTSDKISVEQPTEDVEVKETSSHLLNENYENIVDIKNAKETVYNWNDLYADYDKFVSSSDVTYSQTFKDNILQEGNVSINAQDDVRHVFYNGVDSARIVSNADGYAFTVPTSTTLQTDFSIGKYRSKVYNEDFTLSIS